MTKKAKKQALQPNKINKFGTTTRFEPQTSHNAEAANTAASAILGQNIGTKIGTTSCTDIDNNSDGSEKKKMQKFSTLQEPLVPFRPAQLFTGKSTWYIEYYIWNPNLKTTDPLEKKRKKLIRDLKPFKTKREKLAMAQAICLKLNQKLASGWNPYLEDTAPKGFSTISKAMYAWLFTYKHDKREDTIKWAENKVQYFIKWFGNKKAEKTFIVSIDKFVASSFIDHIYIEKQNSIRTRTNYLDLFTQIFKWLENKGYVAYNPFSKIERVKAKGRKKKIRTVIKDNYPKMINQYFEENNPGYIYAMNYLYLCLIRRTEMTKLKVKDVNLKQQTIYISADIAKNGRERWATIPNQFLQKLHQLGLHNMPQNNYLISSNFYPGETPISPKRISSVWSWMRQKIDMPKTNQFYSLRDTGVIEYLSKGVDNKSLKDHADWQDYAMIGVYADHISHKAIPQIQEKGQMFG